MSGLELLSRKFTEHSTGLDAMLKSMQDEATVFDQNAQTMLSLAAQALQSAGSDQQTILLLAQHISQLEDAIHAEVVGIITGGLLALTGIALGIVAIALAPVSGGTSLFLLIPAVIITGGGATAVGLNAKAIVAAKQSISDITKNISNLNADIALLQHMSTKLKGFADQVDTLKGALGVVVQPWEAAAEYFAQTLNAQQHRARDL